MNPENFLFDGQRARIRKFQSLPRWRQYLALPLVIIAAVFQVLAACFDNGLSITLVLLIAKPMDNFRRWKAMRSGQLHTSFFD